MPASSSRPRPAPQAVAAADGVDPNELLTHEEDISDDVESEDLDTKPSAVVSLPQQPAAACLLTTAVSWEVQISIYTYLRATDLSALQRVSRHFANRRLVNAVIRDGVRPPPAPGGAVEP